MSTSAVALLCAASGAGVGVGSRLLLASLRRGTTVRPGPIEAASAAVGGSAAALTWPDGPWPLALWIGLLAVPLTAVDVRHHRLPDALTLPAVPLTVAICAVDREWASGSGDLGRAVVAGLVVGGLFLLLTIVHPAAMGRGDAKLAFTIGVALGYLGWPAVLVGLFGGFLAGSLVGLAGVVTRRAGLRSAIPFGPALLLGCWLVISVPGLLDRFSPGTAGASAASAAP
jgi:leader peptidase (prepilin peptidase)/N-methyltransferase